MKLEIGPDSWGYSKYAEPLMSGIAMIGQSYSGRDGDAEYSWSYRLLALPYPE